MQGVPGRLLRHGFLDSVPCSRQKQVCEWLDHVLVGRDLSGTRRCGLSPRDSLPGIPDASVSEAPWKGEGPWHPSSSTTSRESPSRRPGPALPPPPQARLHHNPESKTSSGEGKDLPACSGRSPFPGGWSQPTHARSCGPRAGARQKARGWTQASGTAAGLLGPGRFSPAGPASHQPHRVPGSCSLLSQLTSLEPDRLGGEGALQGASSWHQRQS